MRVSMQNIKVFFVICCIYFDFCRCVFCTAVVAVEDLLTFPPVFFLCHGKSITRNTKCGISASFRPQLTWQIYEGREAGAGNAAYKYRESRGGFSEVAQSLDCNIKN